jgi:hypothetical protein
MMGRAAGFVLAHLPMILESSLLIQKAKEGHANY